MESTALEAGQLRHRIQLAEPTPTQDTMGAVQNDNGTVYATTWASVEALSGRELYNAQQRVAEVTHKVTIRWMDGVESNHFVLFDDRQFDVQAVLNPDERHKMLILLCVERDDSDRESAGETGDAE